MSERRLWRHALSLINFPATAIAISRWKWKVVADVPSRPITQIHDRKKALDCSIPWRACCPSSFS
jgi:hypothetical protein